MNTGRQSKQERRREEQKRREEERLQTAKKRKLFIVSLVTALIVVIALVAVYVVNASQATNASAGPVTTTVPACNATEQLDYHVHMHVSIYVNGKLVPIAQGIGIVVDSSTQQVSCYYQTHTHDTSGIIHIEAPQPTTFTLGAFLNLWKDQFSNLQYPAELDNTTGWQAYVDGKAYTGDLAGITLTPHKLVTLAYNSPKVKPDTTYTWANL